MPCAQIPLEATRALATRDGREIERSVLTSTNARTMISMIATRMRFVLIMMAAGHVDVLMAGLEMANHVPHDRLLKLHRRVQHPVLRRRLRKRLQKVHRLAQHPVLRSHLRKLHRLAQHLALRTRLRPSRRQILQLMLTNVRRIISTLATLMPRAPTFLTVTIVSARKGSQETASPAMTSTSVLPRALILTIASPDIIAKTHVEVTTVLTSTSARTMVSMTAM
mmetsp:Transcript_34386/g.74346  ORF Transcript_34386/g.74346 Transcript_34386/m.74346 type:complete len:223 (+) Transcript_34386:541-1209(+)